MVEESRERKNPRDIAIIERCESYLQIDLKKFCHACDTCMTHVNGKLNIE